MIVSLFVCLPQPVTIWTANGPLTSVDHHWTEPIFVTSGDHVDVWDRSRSAPLHSYDWGSGGDAVYTAKFNPAESNLIAASGADNAVGLFGKKAWVLT